jgi:hypothetical protein
MWSLEEDSVAQRVIHVGWLWIWGGFWAVIVRILAAIGGFERACVGECFFLGLAKIRRGFEDLMFFMRRC